LRRCELTTPNKTSADWYYERGGRRFGPFAEEQVENFIKSGAVDSETWAWRTGMEKWERIRLTELGRCFASAPPPIEGTHVNNTIVWILAVAPLIAIFLAGVIAGFGRTEVSVTFVTLALNIGLSLLDERMLQLAGFQTGSLGWAVLVPIYLFRRADLLGQRNAYAWIWIVAFLLSLGAPQNVGHA
jgi:GYF domain 2